LNIIPFSRTLQFDAQCRVFSLLSNGAWCMVHGAWTISFALTMVQYAMGMGARQGSVFCSLFCSEASSQFFMCKRTALISGRSLEKGFYEASHCNLNL
jgi:hypothetical protein